MGPTNTPLSMPVWLIGRRREFMAGGYIFKMVSMALVCILLGYSASRLVAMPDVQQYQGSTVDSLTKPLPPVPSDEVLTADSANLDLAEYEKPHSHEDDPPPTLYRPKVPGQDPSKGQGSFYDKFADRLKNFNSWLPAGEPSKESASAHTGNRVGATEADLHKEQPQEAEEREPLNKTGSYEKILEYKDKTVDSPPLIGKVTIIFGDERPVYDRAVRTHEFHNRLHGYPMHVLRQSILSDVWSKPAYILSVMLREMAKPRDRRVKWLFWSDADTLITNPMVPLEIFLPPTGFEDIDILVTRDWNGLNNGVFLIKINERAINLFSRIITFPYYRPDVQLVFRDQSAMSNLLDTPDFKPHVMEVPQRWFNAYQGEINETIGPHQVRQGDFLIHFAGVTDRDNRMDHWLRRAELHSDEWEVQLRFTSYPREIEEFWKQKTRESAEQKKAIEELRANAKKFYDLSKADAERYKEKFSADQWKNIENAFTKFRNLYENKVEGFDVEIVLKAMEAMKKSLQPLQQTSEQANRILLKETHSVLFSAEKLMLDQEGSQEVAQEVREVDVWISKVKGDILQTPLNADQTEKDAAELRKKYETLNKKVGAIEEAKIKAEKEQERQRQDQLKQQQEAEYQRQQQAGNNAYASPDQQQQGDAVVANGAQAYAYNGVEGQAQNDQNREQTDGTFHPVPDAGEGQ